MVEDKYIGLALAVSSSAAIGSVSVSAVELANKEAVSGRWVELGRADSLSSFTSLAARVTYRTSYIITKKVSRLTFIPQGSPDWRTSPCPLPRPSSTVRTRD